MKILHYFFVYLHFVSVIAFVYCVPLVKSKQGELRGQIEKSRRGREYYAFYGIPYAEPPVGQLRFEDPVPATPWKGIRDATVFPPACIYEQAATIQGEEDCLYLNLYTPDISKDARLPVIVFVYGGRFMYGDASPSRYGPHYFMDNDVILITFHYRQGVFGFLSTQDEVLPGNYGLKDLVAVLKWVQENVDAFGGDINRVTVAGGSSGGITSSLTLVSPLTKGLFHRCISQSGNPFEVDEFLDRKSDAWKIASFVGCATNITISKEMKSCLQEIPAVDLVRTNDKMNILGHISPGLPFGPVVENEKNAGAFLVDQPTKLLQRKSDIPWLLGMNSEDGGMLAIYLYHEHCSDPENAVAEKLNRDYCKYLPQLINYGWSKKFNEIEKDCRVSRVVKNEYFGDGDMMNPRACSKWQTDMFSLSLKRSLDLYRGPKYVYMYKHRNRESFAEMYGAPKDEDFGVIHGDELVSLFNWSSVIKPVVEGVDLIVSQRMVELWCNFAAYGDPNGNGEKIWTPMESPNIEYLRIDNGNFEMQTNMMESMNHEFWNNVFKVAR